jgi:predicted RND superfamily exporter protein
VQLRQLPERLARAQARKPLAFLAAAGLLTAAAALLAAGLRFDSSYYALMPEDAAEVREANLVRERTGGNRLLVVAVSGDDPEARLEFARELAGRMRTIEQIRRADVDFPLAFFEDRALWLADVETLDRIVPAVEEAVRLAKYFANPLALHLDEEEEERELEQAWKEVEEIAGGLEAPLEGVLTSRDGRYTFILVTPWVRIMDLEGSAAMFRSIDEAVRGLSPESRGVGVRYAGKFTLMREVHEVTGRDLRNASILALLIGIVLVAVFTRRFSSPFVVGASLLAGVAWTLAMARILVGQLNVITGFLVAVLLGLGIDFGIHLVIRYQHERRLAGHDPELALIRSVQGTLPPSLTGALTTAGAFLALMAADFRGFSEFGLIAGIGVLLTLVSSFLVLPPLLVLLDRKAGAPGPPPREAGGFGIPKIPAALASLALLAWAAWGASGAGRIRFHNDYTLLKGASGITEFFEYVDENLGFRFDPTAVLVGGVEDAAAVAEVVRQVSRDREERGERTRLESVFSAADLVPQDVEAKRERIARLGEILSDPKLDRARDKGGEQAEKLARARRMTSTEPWGVDDLPEEFRSRLTTLDGSGLVVLIWCTERIESDAKALAWERELDEVEDRLDRAGIGYTMSTETLLPAWVYRMIVADAPRIIVIASLVVLAFILVHLRSVRRALLVAGALAAGMLGFVGVVDAAGWDLNMFNLIVIPCMIGIGIDDLVHIYHRYLGKGPGSAGWVLRRTGAAALLASMTTAAGFGSSLIAHHPGLRSLGSMALVGIACAFVYAVVLLPCLLTLLEASRGPSISPGRGPGTSGGSA